MSKLLPELKYNVLYHLKKYITERRKNKTGQAGEKFFPAINLKKKEKCVILLHIK
jgi:hypothetical protein